MSTTPTYSSQEEALRAFAPKESCAVASVDDPDLEAYLQSGPAGINIVPETYGQLEGKVLKQDTGDFVKWLRVNQPALNVAMPQANRLVLRSGDIWLPLVYLASDVTVPVYLNLVSSYLYDRLKGMLRSDKPVVHLRIRYRNGAESKEFHFVGDPETLRATIKKFDVNRYLDGGNSSK